MLPNPSSPFCVALQNRSVIAVTGQDAQDFLQGQITNDIRDLETKPALFTAMLTPQGRFLYDLFIFKKGDGFYLTIDAARREAFLKRLKLYTLRADVVFTPDADLCLVAANSPDPFNGSSEVFARDPRLEAMGYVGIMGCEDVPMAARTMDVFAAYETERYRLGVPDGVVDLIVDKTIILEANFDELNGIAWEKGCYMGQELMARAKHAGVIRKRYLPFMADQVLEVGQEVRTDSGEKAGRVVSVYGRQGFVLLRQTGLLDATNLKPSIAGEDNIALRIIYPSYLPPIS